MIRRRSPGDPFRMRASEWNEIVDTVDFVRNVPKIGSGAIHDASIVGGNVILVRNETDDPVEQYGVLGLAKGPVMPPATGEDDSALRTWLGQIVMRGHLPEEIVDSDMVTAGQGSSVHRFCVTLEPILPGVLGRAVVSGTVHAWVRSSPDVDDPFPVRVGAVDGSTQGLIHQYDGPCEVLWFSSSITKSADGGVYRLALVRFGPSRPSEFLARITGSTEIRTDSVYGDVAWRYQWIEVVPQSTASVGAFYTLSDQRRSSSGHTQGDAWNLLENMNGDAFTTLGNGARRAFIPDSMEVQPAPVGAIVKMHLSRYGMERNGNIPFILDGQPRFVFEHSNYIDGPCPEPEEE